jgi:hypothetical protein
LSDERNGELRHVSGIAEEMADPIIAATEDVAGAGI